MINSVPYLAVSIPTYNRSKYLNKCLASVIAEIETAGLSADVVIDISDNASTDDTEAIVQNISIQHPSVTIHYSKNKENVGAVNNFIHLTEISGALYTFILGDDDELVEGSLSKVVHTIKENPEVLIHHYKCKQTDFIPAGMPPEKMNPFDGAEKYFYNIGNAGTFIFNTEKAQQIVKEKKARLALTCWPQTEIMFLMLMEDKTKPLFLVSGIELVSSESHGENVSYNSWYILETFCFSLLRIAQNISADYSEPAFIKAAKKAIPGTRYSVKYFFRFLLFITYYDYGYELAKTAELVTDNKAYLKGSNRFYPTTYSLLLSFPTWLKKSLTAFYFFVSKPSFKKSTFETQYREVRAYQQKKFDLYKQKGKLTEDTERYIY